MDNDNKHALLELYASLMEEVKTRLNAIKPILLALGKDGGNPTDFLQAEFCMLQIRMVCELIAIAAAIAHSPFVLTKDILKSWNATRAFGYLTEVNEHCFPKTAVAERIDGRVHLHILENSVSRADLSAIYERCGEMLHRGMVKHVLNGRERIYDMRQIHEWGQNLATLLSCHVILLLEVEQVLFVDLTGGPEGRVQVALGAGGPAAFIPK